MTPDQIVELHRSVCRTLEPALEAVVANHVESGTPVILKGDYLLPATADAIIKTFATEARIRAVFVSESDERQLVENFRVREPGEGEQQGRAKVSALLNAQIEEACRSLSLPVLPTRPWENLLERAVGMTTA